VHAYVLGPHKTPDADECKQALGNESSNVVSHAVSHSSTSCGEHRRRQKLSAQVPGSHYPVQYVGQVKIEVVFEIYEASPIHGNHCLQLDRKVLADAQNLLKKHECSDNVDCDVYPSDLARAESRLRVSAHCTGMQMKIREGIMV